MGLSNTAMFRFLQIAMLVGTIFADQLDAADRPLRIVFLGDSLTAGYQLDPQQAFPALIEGELRRLGQQTEVVNAGVSGDTTAGGLRRLPWLLRRQLDVLVVGLGANDALRGLSTEAAYNNLREIILTTRSRYPEAAVILLGMLAPPNMGRDYATAFNRIYPDLAAEFNLPLMPFLLEGVAAVPELNLPDGIHPNERGHRIIAQNLLPLLATP